MPTVNQIIAQAEAVLAVEDRIAFENLEKAVAWFHEKIRLLLPHVKWEKDSFKIAEVNALLNFHTLALQSSGYIGSLLFELRHVFSEVAQEKRIIPFSKAGHEQKEMTILYLIGLNMSVRA